MAKKAISGYDVHSELYPLSAFFFLYLVWTGHLWNLICIYLGLPLIYPGFSYDLVSTQFFPFLIGIGIFSLSWFFFSLSDHLSVVPLSFLQIETLVFVTGLGCVHLEAWKLGYIRGSRFLAAI
jgi:hypothetical protein